MEPKDSIILRLTCNQNEVYIIDSHYLIVCQFTGIVRDRSSRDEVIRRLENDPRYKSLLPPTKTDDTGRIGVNRGNNCNDDDNNKLYM